MTSGMPPAPRPSSKRPPLSTSSDAAALAIMAGPRSGRFATSVKNEMRSVSAISVGISDHVSRKWRWYGWSWMPTYASPPSSAARTSSRVRSIESAYGMTEIPTSTARWSTATHPTLRCMATWIFEPGHTAAEFRARHMMVTWVRGLFKDIHGRIDFDWDECLQTTFEGEIDATRLWTGEEARDAHLRSADFFDVD